MKTAALILTLLMGPLAANAGNEGGGGGNVCTINGRTRILELAEIAADTSTPGIQIPSTPLMNYIGIDELNLMDGPLKTSVETKLQIWESLHPLLVEHLRDAISHLKFYATPFVPKMSVGADFSRSRACSPANTRASVIYQRYGAFVSVPLFNSLDLESQTAVVLHEAGRILQKQYISDLQKPSKSTHLVFKNNPSDLALQDLVRALMQPPYHDLYENSFFAQSILYAWVKPLKAYCDAAQHWPDLYRQPIADIEELREDCNHGFLRVEKDFIGLEHFEGEPTIALLKLYKHVALDQSPDKTIPLIYAAAGFRMAGSYFEDARSNGQILGGLVSASWDLNFNMPLDRARWRLEGKGEYTDEERTEIDKMATEYKSKLKSAIENLTMLKRQK